MLLWLLNILFPLRTKHPTLFTLASSAIGEISTSSVLWSHSHVDSRCLSYSVSRPSTFIRSHVSHHPFQFILTYMIVFCSVRLPPRRMSSNATWSPVQASESITHISGDTSIHSIPRLAVTRQSLLGTEWWCFHFKIYEIWKELNPTMKWSMKWTQCCSVGECGKPEEHWECDH